MVDAADARDTRRALSPREVGRIAMVIAAADSLVLALYGVAGPYADRALVGVAAELAGIALLAALLPAQGALTVALLSLTGVLAEARRPANRVRLVAAGQLSSLVVVVLLTFWFALMPIVFPQALSGVQPMALMVVLGLLAVGLVTVIAGGLRGEWRLALVDAFMLAFVLGAGFATWTVAGPDHPLVLVAPWWSLHALVGAVFGAAVAVLAKVPMRPRVVVR